MQMQKNNGWSEIMDCGVFEPSQPGPSHCQDPTTQPQNRDQLSADGSELQAKTDNSLDPAIFYSIWINYFSINPSEQR